jgi:hypothetical protein
MTFRRPLFAAALLTSVAVLGLSPVLAQNPPSSRQHSPARIAQFGHGKTGIGSTYINLGSDGDQWILSPTKDGGIIVKHVPPWDPVRGQLKITSAQGTQWRQPRKMDCFNQGELQRCKGYGRVRT